MEKFIIESYPKNGYESKVIKTTKKNFREIVSAYFPKKDERIIDSSIGHINK